jgi:hypothetical protein
MLLVRSLTSPTMTAEERAEFKRVCEHELKKSITTTWKLPEMMNDLRQQCCMYLADEMSAELMATCSMFLMRT